MSQTIPSNVSPPSPDWHAEAQKLLALLWNVARRAHPGDPVRDRYADLSGRFRLASSGADYEAIARQIQRMIDRAEI